jgi:hypothetical protein
MLNAETVWHLKRIVDAIRFRHALRSHEPGKMTLSLVCLWEIHTGSVASGDTVMKSGEDQDQIAEKEGVIVFDCHKNKKMAEFCSCNIHSE